MGSRFCMWITILILWKRVSDISPWLCISDSEPLSDFQYKSYWKSVRKGIPASNLFYDKDNIDPLDIDNLMVIVI